MEAKQLTFDKSTDSIFSHTEVHDNSHSKSGSAPLKFPALPKIGRTVSCMTVLHKSFSSTSSITSSDLPSQQKLHSSVHWEDFLKRSSRQNLEQEYEDKKQNPQALLRKAKKLESSKYIQPGLTALDLKVLRLQRMHNSLHHKVLQQRARLILLTSGLSAYESQSLDASDQTEEEHSQYGKTLEDLAKEEMTEATFSRLIDREKGKIKALGLPITEMQREIQKVNKKIQELLFRHQRNMEKKLTYEKEAEMWSLKRKRVHEDRIESIKELLQSYSDQQQFLLLIYKEDDAQKQVLRQQQKANAFLAKEQEVELKFRTSHLEYEKKIEKLRRLEAQKLLRLDSMKNFAEMSEGKYILSYWTHLTNNSTNLQETSEQLLREIEARTNERDALKVTLTQLKDTCEDDSNLSRELSKAEEALSARAKDVEQKELSLEPVQKLEIAAVNSISRIHFQISEALGKFSSFETVSQQVEFCAKGLEEMLESIMKANFIEGITRSPE